MVISASDIDDAEERIRPYIQHTALIKDHFFANELEVDLWLKLEHQQVSGSFKIRGAFNRILSIPADKRQDAFFVAASTGNHAAAFCHALQTLGLKGKVFLPTTVSQAKLDTIKSYGIPFECVGKNSLHTEIFCRELATEKDYQLVHPYNDPLIIAGQGTIGIELTQDRADIDVVVVPVGGGGLISGIACYLKEALPGIKIVGCQPTQSPEMVRSIEQGSIIKEDITRPTLSDGTAGGMEEGSLTFPMAQSLVDEWALIEEDAIAAEVLYMLNYHQMLVEGAAGLALAYIRQHAESLRGKKVVAIICGKRLSMKVLRKLICI